jgi:AcrR family transcriptional regulator
MSRTYDMSKRSRQAAQTTSRILEATEQLLTEHTLEEITLNNIAKEAGTTVQTVIRHMGSREGCLRAVAEQVAERVEEQRGQSQPGDIPTALTDLVDHYESEGRLILNLLAQEQAGDAYAQEMTEQGRAYHRNWVNRCLAADLTDPAQSTIDALVAATDIYIWKLLRLDLGRSREQVQQTMLTTVQQLLEVP